MERYHRTIKSECIRPKTPLSLEDGRRVVTTYVRQFNEERLHSALQYVTPLDKLLGREQAIFAERDRKLEEARALRAQRRAEQRPQLRETRQGCYTGSGLGGGYGSAGTQPERRPSGQDRRVRLLALSRGQLFRYQPRSQLFGIGTKATNPRGLGGQRPPFKKISRRSFINLLIQARQNSKFR